MATVLPTLTDAAFQEEFLQLRPQLVSYLFRLTTHPQDAEDLAQDTYLKALENLSKFAGRSSLKTWVFSIATNLARDHFRVRSRWGEDIQDRCREATQSSPEKVTEMHRIVNSSPAEKYEFHEHVDYCFSCIAKTLEIEQQLALVLKEIYDFTVAEIMEILQLSEGKVKHAIADARRIMGEIFDRRCVLVSQQGACYQCSEINGFINPKQDAREAMLRLKLVQEAQNGASKERLLDLRSELVKMIDPLNVPGSELHAYLLSLMPRHAPQAGPEPSSNEK